MTEAEVEKVVLDSVRKYTRDETAALEARFAEDLRMSDVARQMLFASLAQAFNARGVSLPSYGFWQKDFLACPTPAAAEAAIRAKVFTRSTGSKTKGGSAHRNAPSEAAPSAVEAPAGAQPTGQPAGEATPAATADGAQAAPAKSKRGRAAKKPAKKKSAGSARKSRAQPPPTGSTGETDWGV
jgi:hypothetical protein